MKLSLPPITPITHHPTTSSSTSLVLHVDLAEAEFRRMDMARAPRDILFMIFGTCECGGEKGEKREKSEKKTPLINTPYKEIYDTRSVRVIGDYGNHMRRVCTVNSEQ